MDATEFLSALLAIVIIDLVLAGDNAIVIGLAARRLPVQQRKRVIFWGTFGAVGIRSLLTLVAVYLLMIPGLLLIGGLLLVWIAYKLIAEEKGHDMKEAASFGEALKTVLIADTVMGLDNVLAVAGAAHGSFLLVVLGLLISVPIVVWGSTLILRLVDRFPIITYIGAGVLAWTAAKMITDEPFMEPYFYANPVLKYVLILAVIAGVVGIGHLAKKRKTKAASPG